MLIPLSPYLSFSALNEDFQMDDVFDRSPISNPSHCPAALSLPSDALNEMQLQKIALHINKIISGSMVLMRYICR